VRLPDGTLVLDVRPIAAFAAGHAQGAISVALDGGSFATRSAFVVGVDEPFVVRADSAEQAHEAQRLLDAVGLAGALGFVTEDGTAARLPTMTVAELAQAAARDAPDPRRPGGGRATSTIPGSTAIPYRELRRTVQGELDRSRPVVTICESGQRATLAASLLPSRMSTSQRPSPSTSNR
jgi:rhodanese-related sulfurtransferase